MNRSLPNVILGGYGVTSSGSARPAGATHTEVTVDSAAELIHRASNIIITPGNNNYPLIKHYGLITVLLPLFEVARLFSSPTETHNLSCLQVTVSVLLKRNTLSRNW